MNETIEIFSWMQDYSKFISKDLENSYLSSLRHRTRWIRCFSPVVNCLERIPLVREPDILFYSRRFPELILDAHRLRRVAVLYGGVKDIQWFFQHHIPWTPAWSWQRKLYDAYVDNLSHQELNSRLVRLIEKIQEGLGRLRPKVLVFSNDALFNERAVILAAKKMGIPTVTIQDGYYSHNIDARFFHGQFADYVLVWGQYFKDLYSEKGVLSESNVGVLGYPYIVSKDFKSEAQAVSSDFIVCFMGQPYEKYNKTSGVLKDQVVSNVVKACEDRGVPFVYRPHPAEDRSQLAKDYPLAALTPPNEKIEESFRRYHVFISISSTALIEASLRGRFAVQILETGLIKEDFATLGICPSVVNDSEKIAKLLEDIRKGTAEFQSIRSEFLSVPTGLGKRFVEVMADLGIEI